PNHFTREPDSGESQHIRYQLAQAWPCIACEFAEHPGDDQRRHVKIKDLAKAGQYQRRDRYGQLPADLRAVWADDEPQCGSELLRISIIRFVSHSYRSSHN